MKKYMFLVIIMAIVIIIAPNYSFSQEMAREMEPEELLHSPGNDFIEKLKIEIFNFKYDDEKIINPSQKIRWIYNIKNAWKNNLIVPQDTPQEKDLEIPIFRIFIKNKKADSYK